MNIKELIEQFEIEVWLYLDNDLSESRKLFWDEQINLNPQLNEILKDAEITNSLMQKETSVPELSETKFNEILDKTIQKKQKIFFVDFLKRNSIDKNISNAKVLVMTAAAAAAIALMIILPEKTTENIDEALNKYAWKSQPVEEKIDKINYQFENIKEKEFNQQVFTNYNISGWDMKVNNIYGRIKQIENQINQKSL